MIPEEVVRPTPATAPEDLAHFVFGWIVTDGWAIVCPPDILEPRAPLYQPEQVDGTNTISITVNDLDLPQRRGGRTGDHTVDETWRQVPVRNMIDLERLHQVVRARRDDVRVRGVTAGEDEVRKRADLREIAIPGRILTESSFGYPKLS